MSRALDSSSQELVIAFLEKWSVPMNGGDERHVHNDLDRLVAAVRRETQDEAIAWLRDGRAMSEFDGLSECIYDTAVFPEDLAAALEKSWPSSSNAPKGDPK